jgi:hypothetical protein
MITVHLQGGLGNQLFQYAAGLAVRQSHGGRLWFIEDPNPHNLRGHDYVTELFVEGRHHPRPSTAAHEGHAYIQYCAYDAWAPRNFVGAAAVYLKGYFQSLAEIRPILDELRTSFLPQLRKKTGIYTDVISEYGFVHVRRGDYLKNPTYHWIQPAAYYETAMSMIEVKKWLVFSDDIQWCKEQACFQKENVLICEEADELVALDVMSSCAAAVISNSTFSWWAAMLGNMKRVVFPDLWCEDHKPSLFPEEWIRLTATA